MRLVLATGKIQPRLSSQLVFLCVYKPASLQFVRPEVSSLGGSHQCTQTSQNDCCSACLMLMINTIVVLQTWHTFEPTATIPQAELTDMVTFWIEILNVV